MAAELDVDLDKEVGQGAGLVFVACSDMLTRMPRSPIWSVVFNFTLFSLGIRAVGGMFLLQVMDGNLTFWHLFIGLGKVLTFAWMYGVHRLSDDIKTMTGWNIPKPMQHIYKYLTPGIICVILVLRFFGVKPLRYRSYTFPAWCNIMSGGLAVVLAAIIPAVAVYKLFCTHTDIPLKQRINLLTSPPNDEMFECDANDVAIPLRREE